MSNYIPDRNDICLLDFEPAKGKEIGKNRPILVLSSKTYSKLSGLVICLPISTSIRGAPTEVPVTTLDSPCVVATTLPQTLDYKARKIKYIGKAEKGLYDEVLIRLLPLLGAEHLIKEM